ncbi:MAG TPA: cupin domain-containing protein [bacterium]
MPIIQLDQREEREIVPGFKARFVHTNNVTLAYWQIKAGSALPQHSHHHEMVVNVIDGKLELTIDGESQIIEPGRIAIIPSHVRHSARALTDCQVIDVFYPVREDYK